MFLRGFEGWHLVIIAGLLVVLFGARKLPDSARSIGQSLRIFKSEMKAAHDDPDPQPAARTEQAAPGVLEPGQPQVPQDAERVGAGHERL